MLSIKKTSRQALDKIKTSIQSITNTDHMASGVFPHAINFSMAMLRASRFFSQINNDDQSKNNNAIRKVIAIICDNLTQNASNIDLENHKHRDAIAFLASFANEISSGEQLDSAVKKALVIANSAMEQHANKSNPNHMRVLIHIANSELAKFEDITARAVRGELI